MENSEKDLARNVLVLALNSTCPIELRPYLEKILQDAADVYNIPFDFEEDKYKE